MGSEGRGQMSDKKIFEGIPSQLNEEVLVQQSTYNTN